MVLVSSAIPPSALSISSFAVPPPRFVSCFIFHWSFWFCCISRTTLWLVPYRIFTFPTLAASANTSMYLLLSALILFLVHLFALEYPSCALDFSVLVLVLLFVLARGIMYMFSIKSEHNRVQLVLFARGVDTRVQLFVLTRGLTWYNVPVLPSKSNTLVCNCLS